MDIAAHYSDGLSAKLHQVKLGVRDDIVSITNDELSVNWPMNSLRQHPAPADRSIVFGPRNSDAFISVAPQHTDALRALLPVLLDPKRQRRSTWLLGGSLTALAAGLAGFMVFGLPALSGPLADITPLEIEARMGAQSNQFVSMFSNECEASELAQASLDELGQRLEDVSNSPFELKLRVVDAGFPNAFALPGGWIVITDDLIDLMETPDELAGVLAHETAHVSQRHVMAGQIREMGFGMLLELLLGGGSGAGQELARAGASLESIRHTRSAETEADDYALQYLVDADLDPHGLADFFDRLSLYIEGQSGGETSNTGPETGPETSGDEPADPEAPEESVDVSVTAEPAEPQSDGWLEALLRTHPETRARAASARAAADAIGWSGDPAMTAAGWAALGDVCTDEDIASDQATEDLVETVRDVLNLGDDDDETEETPVGEAPD